MQPALHVLQLEREAVLHTSKYSLSGVDVLFHVAFPELERLPGLCLSSSQETPIHAEELHGVGKY